jgi:lipopolysaccharide transport system ATP-binding protein
MNAAVLGLSTEEVDRRFDAIAAFADIGDFIERPVKTYSSGMMLRLAFAVIAHVDADILVVDEALSVGDTFFTQKCMRYLRNFMKTGTVLFVSHDTGAVVNLCSAAILLGRGEITEAGSPKKLVERYLAALYESDQNVDGLPAYGASQSVTKTENAGEYRDMRDMLINASTLRNDIEVFRFDIEKEGFGTGEAKIVSVRLLNQNGAPLLWIVGGEDVVLEIRCDAYKEISHPIVGFQFKDRLGQVVFCDNTYLVYRHNPLSVQAGTTLIARFEFRLPKLPTGDYTISPAIADGTQEQHVQLHWLHDALALKVHASSVVMGIIGLTVKNISMESEQTLPCSAG